MSDYTVKWPLDFTDRSIGFESVGEENIKDMVVFNLKNIILTEPSERLFYPEMGVGIRKFLFEQSTGLDVENLRYEIISQVKRYAPYVSIINLQIEIYENSLSVILAYEVEKVNINDILVLNLEL